MCIRDRNDFIKILKEFDEPFDESKILGQGKNLHRAKIQGTMQRVNQLSAKEKQALYDTQIEAFKNYGYELNI